LIDVKTMGGKKNPNRWRVRLVGTALLAFLVVPQLAEACAVCYGAVDSGMTTGMNNGILVLLAIIAAVQVGFVALFLSIRQRARQMRQQEDRFQVIQGGAG
jgi:uncharacterized membrane protein